MLKRIIATSLVAMALMLGGCGETDSTGSDRIAAQNAIDRGNVSDAINILLGSQTLASALNTMSDDDKILLGSAYMTEAGFSMTDIISIVMTDDANATDTFDSFKSQVAKTSNDHSLDNIDDAIRCFQSSTLTSAPSKAGAIPTLSDEDLKLAFAILVKAALLYSDDTSSDEAIASFINDVFVLLTNMDGLDDLEAEINKVKVDIASQADTDFNLVYVDGADYSNVTVEAADIATYR